MRVVLAGGGTGGHLIPGIALAQQLQETFDDAQVLFIASDREMDMRTLRRYDYQALHLTSRPITMNPTRWPAFTRDNFRAFKQAYRMIAEFAPDVAVGLGGFASFFPLVAARLQRVPIVLMEQNVLPGKSTRRLMPFAKEIACQWPQTVRHCGVKAPARITGNPIRREILSGTREEGIERLHLEHDRPTMLVIGGSQGAQPLNEMMMNCAPQLAASAPELQIVHLTGQEQRQAVARAYEQAGIRAEVLAYLDDMHLAYRAADFALSRAGGTTIAEFTACGLPAILVPYPHAADNHQLLNAQALAEAGAAVVLEQHEATADLLTRLIGRFLDSPEVLKRMRCDSLAQGRPNAAETVVEMLERYVKRQPVAVAAEALRPEPVSKEHL